MFFNKDILEMCQKNQTTTLSDICEDMAKKDLITINNPYILLAYKFLWYESGGKDETGDYYFYKYLKERKDNNSYSYPTKTGTIEVSVELFKPFSDLNKGVVNPRWHLLVSHYAYIDAAFNHPNNEYAKNIAKLNGWKRKNTNFSCKSLKQWISEL